MESTVSVLGRLASEWTGRWRHPDLAVALASDGDLHDDTLADLLLQGYARPRGDLEGARHLAQRGEFALVETFLQEVAALSGEVDADELHDDLERARSSALRGVEARVVALRARAREVGIDPTIPEHILATAAARVSNANRLLDAVQAHVEESEAAVTERLRRQLDESMESAARQPPLQLREAVERCLELRQFAVARALLESGDAEPTRSKITVPRRIRLPWHRPPGELLEWFSDPAAARAPAGLHAGWLPPEDDTAAHALVSALTGLIRSGPAEEVERVAAVAHQLDAVIGGPADGGHRARPGTGGILVESHALADETLALLIPFAAGPVTLLVVTDAEADPSTDEYDVALWITDGPVPTIGSPALDVEDLLWAIGDTQHRRVHLLRAIGRQIDWTTGLAPRHDAPALQGADAMTLGARVADLLDLLGADPEPAFADVLVHMAGAIDGVVLDLVAAALRLAAPTRPAMRIAQLTRATSDPMFLDSTRTRLVSGLNSASRAVLGATVELTDDDQETVTQVELREALEVLWDVAITDEEVDRAVAELAAHGVLNASEGAVTMSRAVRMLVGAAVGDTETLIAAT
jgi:hypothetical protein